MAPDEQNEQEKQGDEPEVPVPTDYRGNLWILLLMLGVIVAAWLVKLFAS